MNIHFEIIQHILYKYIFIILFSNIIKCFQINDIHMNKKCSIQKISHIEISTVYFFTIINERGSGKGTSCMTLFT